MNDQRFEIKFVLNLRGIKFLESWLEIGKIFKRSFNDRIVHSVYSDDIYYIYKILIQAECLLQERNTNESPLNRW